MTPRCPAAAAPRAPASASGGVVVAQEHKGKEEEEVLRKHKGKAQQEDLDD